jgi:hypothetical protein
MIQILPIHPQVLPDFCLEKHLDDDAPVWGYMATQGTTLLGWCVVAKDDPCRILGLEAQDQEVADGLLRAALHPFYEEGIQEYRFKDLPGLPLPSRYMMAGVGRLADIFTPCGHEGCQ